MTSTEPKIDLPIAYFSMALDVQAAMDWPTKQQALGALGGVLDSAVLYRRDTMKSPQLALAGGVASAEADAFVRALLDVGFVATTDDRALVRVPIVTEFLGRSERRKTRARSGGIAKAAKHSASTPQADAKQIPSTQIACLEDACGPPGNGQADAKQAPSTTQADAKHSASTPQADAKQLASSCQATALSGGLKGDDLCSSSLTLQSEQETSVFVASEGSHETSPRAREGATAMPQIAAATAAKIRKPSDRQVRILAEADSSLAFDELMRVATEVPKPGDSPKIDQLSSTTRLLFDAKYNSWEHFLRDYERAAREGNSEPYRHGVRASFRSKALLLRSQNAAQGGRGDVVDSS